jgi:hypothetical protein
MKPICLTYHQPTDRGRAIASMHKSLRSIGQSMISQKKAEILVTTEIGGKGRVEKSNIQGRDLLSLLIKANMATDIPDRARMTDEDILERESKSYDAFSGSTDDDDTFRRGSDLPACRPCDNKVTYNLLCSRGIYSYLVLSVALAWALYALGCHPAAQGKLKAEARAFYTDTPSMDELNGMTYLDYVTREALRLHTPASNAVRSPTKDTVVPLSEPFIDRHGVKRHEFRQVTAHAVLHYFLVLIKWWVRKRVREGDTILVPILAVHRLKSLWGEDADEFK